MVAKDLAFVEPHDRAAWRSWLESHAATTPGVWLAVGKKGNSVTQLTYDEAVEEALCFGWIDSTTHRLDADRFRQLFTPRKPTSAWSQSNKARVERLIAEGRMTDAGMRAIEVAKANGSWTLIDDVESLVMPADLTEALAATPQAADGFERLTVSQRKMALYWIAQAKRAPTRSARIAKTVAAAVEHRPPV